MLRKSGMWIGEFELSRVRSPLSSQRLPGKLGLLAALVFDSMLGGVRARDLPPRSIQLGWVETS
jgi:hypothetical protein